MRLMQWVMAATFVCGLSVFTACSNDDNSANPTPGVDSKIVGNWFSDVSGKTYAKWNYDKTWQNTEFKADGTGSTCIYYMLNGKPLGIEKINFTYTASADGTLTMSPKDREAMKAKWQLVGYEQCDFHKLTGWGRWLNTNQQELYCNPQQGGGGKLE